MLQDVAEILCPRCGSSDVRRSVRRNFWERLLSLVLLPYRCEACGERFFRWRYRRGLLKAKSKPRPNVDHP